MFGNVECWSEMLLFLFVSLLGDVLGFLGRCNVDYHFRVGACFDKSGADTNGFFVVC